jgi:hypothetical protein
LHGKSHYRTNRNQLTTTVVQHRCRVFASKRCWPPTASCCLRFRAGGEKRSQTTLWSLPQSVKCQRPFSQPLSSHCGTVCQEPATQSCASGAPPHTSYATGSQRNGARRYQPLLILHPLYSSVYVLYYRPTSLSILIPLLFLLGPKAGSTSVLGSDLALCRVGETVSCVWAFYLCICLGF